MESGRYRPEELKTFCKNVFAQLGMRVEDAEVVSDSLVRANLEGTDSHGVSRMGIYTGRMKEGRIAADPTVKIDHEGAVLRVDGGNGLGQIASSHALKDAFPLARESGIVGVGVRNSNHFGAAAYYCQMASREGMALIATTNSPPGIAPWGGQESLLRHQSHSLRLPYPARATRHRGYVFQCGGKREHHQRRQRGRTHP